MRSLAIRSLSVSSKLRILVHGEPTSSDPSGYDIAFLTGGSNRYTNAAYYPFVALPDILRTQANQSVEESTGVSKRPIDVLYQSSHCEPAREALAKLIGDACRRAGLSFVASGACTAGQPSASQRGQPGGEKGLQKTAKMMLAFERMQEGYDYLSEKLFMPMVAGAIPLYFGNGQHLMDTVRVNKERVLDRGNYGNDAAFVDAVITLLQDKDRLDAFSKQQLFDPEGPVDMSTQLPVVDQKLRALVDSNPTVKALRDRNGPSLTLSIEPATKFGAEDVVALFAHLLGLPADKLSLTDGSDADISVTQCCWPSQSRPLWHYFVALAFVALALALFSFSLRCGKERGLD